MARLVAVVRWFDRTPREVTRSLLRPRKVVPEGDRVLLQDLEPSLEQYLGQLLALQLVVLQQAGQAVAEAPTLAAKANLVEALRIVSTRYRDLVLLLPRDVEPLTAMEPFFASSERFAKEVAGADWYEQVLSLHVTTGLLSDFFVAYGAGLPDDDRDAVLRVLTRETGQPLLARELQRAIAQNPRLAARMALWGRRLVGDTLLQMYLAVHGPEDASPAPSQRLEPAFNDIVASHTRRMDALGLTA
ncbi:hypothetical protein C1N71_04980 [Agrococcus sp. SGAir0287]|nr:hypothetical protein C1N71_04980 [Agrococcus sp. SGAir0287]